MNEPTKELLFLGMFDVARPDRARAVRIYNLHQALKALTPVRLIDGDRPARRKTLLRFLAQGGLRRTRAIYVEASSSTATETDLLLLTLAHRKRIPIIVFVPDAYQYFPQLYPRAGIRMALLDWGWRRSIATYLRVADRLMFPSQGLAGFFPARQRVGTLPPGGPPGLTPVNPDWATPTIVYVGGATFRYGSDLLLEAMQQVVDVCPTARCHFITADATYLNQHPLRQAPWLTLEHRTFEELPAIMQGAAIAVVPLRRTSYNDLAIPVKLFDYMAFGLPVLATDCRDMAALVQELQSGLVVADNVEAVTQGILRLLTDRELATRLGRNGYQAIQTAHSWAHRARQLLQMIERIENKE